MSKCRNWVASPKLITEAEKATLHDRSLGYKERRRAREYVRDTGEIYYPIIFKHNSSK